MLPRKLIIFDYSGTISLESVLFGQPDYLMKQLRESGLTDLGVTSPSIFWEQIVNPTWVKGSTTQVGYKKIIEDRINTIFHQNMCIVSNAKISDAASLFVDSYLNHSGIDGRWQPVFEKLNRYPSVRVIIATDHYAEATGYILKYLEEFHVETAAARTAMAVPRNAAVIVANSADLGFHKDNFRFWTILKDGLCMDEVRQVLLIDDFGGNEERENSYSEPEKVEQRKRVTVRLLQEIFSAEVQAVPFIIEGYKNEKDVSDLITKTSAIIDRYLAASNGG